jgi:hypothetical protein
MSKIVLLKPKDWVIFRDYPENLFGKRSSQFNWRIGRIAGVVGDDAVDISPCAPEFPRETKKRDPEAEPWNTAWIFLPEFPAEYLIVIHLRNRRSIAWLTEARPRRIKRADVVLANNVALAEVVLASTQNRF